MLDIAGAACALQRWQTQVGQVARLRLALESIKTNLRAHVCELIAFLKRDRTHIQTFCEIRCRISCLALRRPAITKETGGKRERERERESERWRKK